MTGSYPVPHTKAVALFQQQLQWKTAFTLILWGFCLMMLQFQYFFEYAFLLPALGMVFTFLGFYRLRNENKAMHSCCTLSLIALFVYPVLFAGNHTAVVHFFLVSLVYGCLSNSLSGISARVVVSVPQRFSANVPADQSSSAGKCNRRSFALYPFTTTIGLYLSGSEHADMAVYLCCFPAIYLGYLDKCPAFAGSRLSPANPVQQPARWLVHRCIQSDYRFVDYQRYCIHHESLLLIL